MGDVAWKQLERRVCRMFGGERRGPDGIGQSDCVGTDVAVQVKRSKRGTPEGKWIEDARRQAAAEEKPWVLVVSKHGSSDPVAVCSAKWLAAVLETNKKANAALYYEHKAERCFRLAEAFKFRLNRAMSLLNELEPDRDFKQEIDRAFDEIREEIV